MAESEVAAQFCDNSDALCSKLFVFDAEGGDSAWVDTGYLRRDELNIFGEDVLARDDDNIRHPANNKQVLIER